MISWLGYIRNNEYKQANVTIKLDENRDFDIFFDDRKVAHIPDPLNTRPSTPSAQDCLNLINPLYSVLPVRPQSWIRSFDNTSGYIIWLNHNGIMVDPPVNSTSGWKIRT